MPMRASAASTPPQAKATPGVLAVLTGADFLADGLKPIPHKPWSPHPAEATLRNKSGEPPFEAPHYPLPADKARFVGEAVAMVVAETVHAAKNGAEAIAIDYDVLPAVVETVAAARQDAPIVHEPARSNVCFDSELGDAAATEAAFARAAHVTRFETWVQRVTGVPMEPRGALAAFDAATGRFTVYAGNGGAVRLKNDLATMLGVEPDKVRVLMGDVGGNFGTRGMIYPEFALVAWAAKKLGRPVKWIIERSESFLSDYQARDLVVEAELALDHKGKFLAMRGANLGNLGAHTTNFAMVQKGVQMMSSIYRMPAAHFRARATLSNTAPTRPYRSAGRPEVIFVMERLIDLAARECGYDRVALRRKNLVTEKEMPYKNPFGVVYDNGDYIGGMDIALKLGDWDGFKQRRKEAKKRGKYRGIAVGNYVDISTGVPREKAEITVSPDGFVELVIGIVSQGQGHETSFAQLITEWLGVPIETRALRRRRYRPGHGRRRRAFRARHAARLHCHQEIHPTASSKKALRIAEHLLETAAADIEFKDGRFAVKGTNHAVGIFEVARAAAERKDLPEDLQGPLYAACDETVLDASYPYGAHVCEVEVDADTGKSGADQLCRRRRRRPRGQSAHHSRPGPRRHRPGRRPGAARTRVLRSGERANAGRLVDGLRHAARLGSGELHHRDQRSAVLDAPARHPPRRRRRHGPGARRRRQRHRRCACRPRRPPRRNAGDAGAGMAGDRSGAQPPG